MRWLTRPEYGLQNYHSHHRGFSRNCARSRWQRRRFSHKQKLQELQEFRSCRIGSSLVWKKTLGLELGTNDKSAQTGVAGVTGVQELQNAELSGVEENFWLESDPNGRSSPASTR